MVGVDALALLGPLLLRTGSEHIEEMFELSVPGLAISAGSNSNLCRPLEHVGRQRGGG